MNFALRPATERDKAFLRRLTKESYEPVVVEQFGAWNDEVQDRNFEKKWAIQNYRIVESKSEAIGAIWYTMERDHLWLREVQISKAYRNRGIGTQLVLGLIEEAKAVRLPLRLRVLTANRAKSLYDRLGFRLAGKYQGTHHWMVFDP